MLQKDRNLPKIVQLIYKSGLAVSANSNKIQNRVQIISGYTKYSSPEEFIQQIEEVNTGPAEEV